MPGGALLEKVKSYIAANNIAPEPGKAGGSVGRKEEGEIF